MSNSTLLFEKISTGEQDTQSIAKEFYDYLSQNNTDLPIVIYLDGNLGAGKTTFVRYFLKSSGYSGFVKSPTFTIVESYDLKKLAIHHFDLYRLVDPEELEYIGIDEYFENSISFIEWSCHGEGYIRKPNFIIKIEMQESITQRTIKIFRS